MSNPETKSKPSPATLDSELCNHTKHYVTVSGRCMGCGVQILKNRLLPMEEAPKDGTVILMLIRHPNWVLAHAHDNQDDWEQEALGRWTDHNGGGWTWHGMMGEPVGFYSPNAKGDSQSPAKNL